MIKPSSMNTKGMLARKYKWMNGGGTGHHGDPAHNPVKPDSNYPGNLSQGSYIESKASTAAITGAVKDGGDKSCHAIGGKCGHHIAGKYYQRNMYYKNPSQQMSYDQYKLFLTRKSLRNCAYCETGKLCPPGSCPTCKGHYDSTAGASIESPEFDVRLGLKPCCPDYTYEGPREWPNTVPPSDVVAGANANTFPEGFFANFRNAIYDGEWDISVLPPVLPEPVSGWPDDTTITRMISKFAYGNVKMVVMLANIPSRNDGLIWVYGTSEDVPIIQNPGWSHTPKFATNTVTVDFVALEKRRFISSVVGTAVPIYFAGSLPNGPELLPFMKTNCPRLLPYP